MPHRAVARNSSRALETEARMQTPPIDSSSEGDPRRHLDYGLLQAAFLELPPAPATRGRVVQIVRRGEGGRREYLEHTRVTPHTGVPGDAWARRSAPDPDEQITAMQAGVARLLANGQPLGLFGDNLFLDLDLSANNLPPGSVLRIGTAGFVITAKPHTGCRKFLTRFGRDALRFVSEAAHRSHNLRGVHLRVLEPGEVRLGAEATVMSRGVHDPEGPV